jgi:hypothetical protein
LRESHPAARLRAQSDVTAYSMADAVVRASGPNRHASEIGAALGVDPAEPGTLESTLANHASEPRTVSAALPERKAAARQTIDAPPLIETAKTPQPG